MDCAVIVAIIASDQQVQSCSKSWNHKQSNRHSPPTAHAAQELFVSVSFVQNFASRDVIDGFLQFIFVRDELELPRKIAYSRILVQKLYQFFLELIDIIMGKLFFFIQRVSEESDIPPTVVGADLPLPPHHCGRN